MTDQIENSSKKSTKAFFAAADESHVVPLLWPCRPLNVKLQGHVFGPKSTDSGKNQSTRKSIQGRRSILSALKADQGWERMKDLKFLPSWVGIGHVVSTRLLFEKTEVAVHRHDHARHRVASWLFFGSNRTKKLLKNKIGLCKRLFRV